MSESTTVHVFRLSCCGNVLDNSRVSQPDWVTHARGCEFDARMPGRHVSPGSIWYVCAADGTPKQAWVTVDGVHVDIPCSPEDAAFYASVEPTRDDEGDPTRGLPSWAEVSVSAR